MTAMTRRKSFWAPGTKVEARKDETSPWRLAQVLNLWAPDAAFVVQFEDSTGRLNGRPVSLRDDSLARYRFQTGDPIYVCVGEGRWATATFDGYNYEKCEGYAAPQLACAVLFPAAHPHKETYLHTQIRRRPENLTEALGPAFRRGLDIEALDAWSEWRLAKIDFVYDGGATPYRVIFDHDRERSGTAAPGRLMNVNQIRSRLQPGDQVEVRVTSTDGRRHWRAARFERYGRGESYGRGERCVVTADRHSDHDVSREDVRRVGEKSPAKIDNVEPVTDVDVRTARVLVLEGEIARLRAANSTAAQLLEHLGLNNQEHGNAVLAWLDGEGRYPETAKSVEDECAKYDGRSFYAYAIPGTAADVSKGVALNDYNVQYDLRVEYATRLEAEEAARTAWRSRVQKIEWEDGRPTVALVSVPDLDSVLSDLGEGVLSGVAKGLVYMRADEPSDEWIERVTDAHDDELDAAVHRTVFEWLRKRNLLPGFCFVDEEQELELEQSKGRKK
jgi:hypothetical protein